MKQNNDFETSIKSALTHGEDKMILNTALLDRVKFNLKMENGKKDINMLQRNRFSRIDIKKGVIAVCAVAVVTTASATFIKPVGAFAAKIKTMIYDVVKGDDGKYVAIKIPYEEPEVKTMVGELPSVDDSNTNIIKSKMPLTLSDGYELYSQSSVAYNPKNSNMLSISKKPSNDLFASAPAPSLKLPEGWKDGTDYWYKKAASTIVVSENNFNCAFVSNTSGVPLKGDNKKEITIAGQSLTYAEYPDARYPYVKDNEDRTQAPSIHVAHTLMWTANGKYYTMYDFNGDLSIETLKPAAETVINNLK